MHPGIPRTTFIGTCLLTACIAIAASLCARAQQSAPGHSARDTHEEFLVVMGVGVANGARLGVQYRIAPQFDAEASFGYVRMINYLGYTDKPPTSIGITPTVGITYLSTEAPITRALASLLVSYQIGSRKIVWAHERRIAFSVSIGSEIRLVDNMVLQVRAGPSLHIILQPIRGIVQTFMHYDGGLGWRF